MANLANIILEGASRVPSVELGDYNCENMVVCDSSYVTSAISTLFSDIMEAEQGYMIADVVGAATIIRENAGGESIDPAMVFESVVKDGIAKLKVAFQKFIAKIKEYYHRVIDWFKAMTADAETFAKKFGDHIKKKYKTVKGFHYSGYKYTYDDGDKRCTNITNEIDKTMKKAIGGFDFVNAKTTTPELIKKLQSDGIIDKSVDTDNKPSVSETIDKYITNDLKFDDIAEMRLELTKSFHNKDTDKSDIKDFEANSADDMVNYLTKSKSLIKDLQDQLKHYEEAANTIIGKLKKYESAKDEEGGSNIVAHASYISTLLSNYLNLYKVPCEVRISVAKDMTATYLGVLKKFYNFKGNAVKESTNVFDAEAYAMLENAIILEGEDDSDPEDESGDGDATTESIVAGILEQAARYTF